eukprot:Nitzschia sp. Nitz4//scaffold301_size22573//7432//8769//NITZ4_008551-RA/size22573-processed-gene-0.18-mRNA-1//1//CDS//3329547007//9071//frame0
MSTSSHLSLGFVDDWEHFLSVYGAHVLIGLFLSAVTIYRREMSCNRVFHEEEAKETPPVHMPRAYSLVLNQLEQETDDLLDGAGMYCSGHPIRQIASVWIDSFAFADPLGQEPHLPVQLLQEKVTPSDLLDRVGNFYSGDPFATAMNLLLHHPSPRPMLRQGPSLDPFTNQLPADVHVNIASFLHPKDVLSLACVSRTYNKVVDQSETSLAIWRTLWLRDYAWLLYNWMPGIEARKRSERDLPFPLVVDKEFYFAFGETYMNYVLAGHCSMSSSLVGLHCQIYDITRFLERHPGSPDTLLVHAGRDATRLFEDMGHSLNARRQAPNFCVVADLSQLDNNLWGLRPTKNTTLIEDPASTCHTLPPVFENAGRNLLVRRKNRARGGTLLRVREKLEAERAEMEREVMKTFDMDRSILGMVHLYYDSLLQEWRIWYLDEALEVVVLTV